MGPLDVCPAHDSMCPLAGQPESAVGCEACAMIKAVREHQHQQTCVSVARRVEHIVLPDLRNYSAEMAAEWMRDAVAALFVA